MWLVVQRERLQRPGLALARLVLLGQQELQGLVLELLVQLQGQLVPVRQELVLHHLAALLFLGLVLLALAGWLRRPYQFSFRLDVYRQYIRRKLFLASVSRKNPSYTRKPAGWRASESLSKK